ncbi:P-loop containing nucleoside triphosphate hydrolase protein [Ganoderma leucocontextum]|nr:P-loop containing nucleoside triphosphate hydrolase protein [Ganoderma leucocontextum]
MLYDYEFGIVTIDEGAKMRNPSHHWTTMNELSRLSHCTIAATATPITNSPLDLVYIGRCIGIPACEEETLLVDMKKKLMAAARKSNVEFRNAREEGDVVQRILSGELDLPAKKEQVKQMTSYTVALRKMFNGHTIRRTLDAVDWEGQPISGLEPYVSQQLMLTPLDEEAEVLEVTAAAITTGGRGRPLTCPSRTDTRECGGVANVVPALTGAFYGRFRRSHLHYKLLDDPLWAPKDMADWEATTSMKLQNLVDILLHHLSEDNAPLLRRASQDSNELDADPEWEMQERDDDIDYPNRIIVYVAFPSNNPLITKAIYTFFCRYHYLHSLISQVLGLHGIKYIEVNGSKQLSVRSKDIEKFRSSDRDGPRVCLLSNVGTMGLNLPQANILVALDQMWSHQDLLQLIGRIWRHPQKKQVLVYQPCLEHTTDMFLSVLSFSKNALLAAFTKSSKETSTSLIIIFMNLTALY